MIHPAFEEGLVVKTWCATKSGRLNIIVFFVVDGSEVSVWALHELICRCRHVSEFSKRCTWQHLSQVECDVLSCKRDSELGPSRLWAAVTLVWGPEGLSPSLTPPPVSRPATFSWPGRSTLLQGNVDARFFVPTPTAFPLRPCVWFAITCNLGDVTFWNV